jgi:putative hydrolase of the HAD superfamily
MGLSVVLFDFFGTLAAYEPDRAALAYPMTHSLLETWGQEMSHDEFVALWHRCSLDLEASTSDSLVEISMLEYAAAFGRCCPAPLSTEKVAEVARIFVAEWQAHIRPIPGAGALIASLAARYRLGVVSNTSDTSMVPSLLSDFFPSIPFDPVVLSVDHGRRKPHPSIYERALGALGCTAEEVAFVGDSYEADYLGPRSVGMRALLIDPLGTQPVDDADRLASLLDLAARLD